MFYYNKSPKQMVVDLINQANPELPFPINAVDYEFLDPVNISETPEGHNTRILLYAHDSAPYMGNIQLTYRRLDLARLFWGMTPRVQKWKYHNRSDGDNSASVITLFELLPLLSKTYGLLLDDTQINNVSFTAYSGVHESQTRVMSARTDSLIYRGQVNVNWMRGLQGVDDVLTEDETLGIYYPGGNDFTDLESRPMYLTPVTHDYDFTLDYQNAPIKSYWSNWSGQQLGVSNSSYDSAFQQWWGAFADLFEARTGIRPTYAAQTNQYNNYKTIPFDFTGFTVIHTSLPSTAYPEANSDFFNRVTVITCPDDCPWAAGYIYLHYNV